MSCADPVQRAYGRATKGILLMPLCLKLLIQHCLRFVMLMPVNSGCIIGLFRSLSVCFTISVLYVVNGPLFCSWMGAQITERGLGNGVIM